MSDRSKLLTEAMDHAAEACKQHHTIGESTAHAVIAQALALCAIADALETMVSER